MRLRAKDTLHVSSAIPKGRQEEGSEFTINDGEGADLIRRGLADEVKEKAPASNKARKAAPKNKGN